MCSRREKPFPKKNPKINPFVAKSFLETKCKRFRQSAIRENFNLKPETQLKKLIPITEATIPINTMKQKRSCNQFPSFMSEPYLSTRSKTFMHLKKIKLLSSLRRPETHVRHAQGHQRAGASTGSINIIQNTIITVYEVEYQKTVNTKLGKQTIRFSEVIKDIYHYFPKKNRLEDEKDRKESCIAFLKLINRYYKIIWQKSTSIFEEQTRIPIKLTIQKNECRQKRTTIEHFLQISFHTEMKSTREAISQQKTPKSIHSWSNHFWNPIANVSVKVQYEKTSI